MTRLATASWTDVRLQVRHGFYYAAAFVLVVTVIILRQLPGDVLPWLLPVLVLSNVQINLFYFLAGLILLEKSEGSLEALSVTPLRSGEYLASKLLSLAGLTLAENGLLVALTHGKPDDAAGLLLGLVASSWIFLVGGLVTVARYDSVNAFLMPSFLATAALSVPLVEYFGIAGSPLFDLHPIAAPLDALSRALDPSHAGPSPIGWAATLAWGLAATPLAVRIHRRMAGVRAGSTT